MELWYALLLGVIQGLTEFLPVSSSGHLVIVQSLLPGFEQPGALFDVVLHLGTLFAILVYFYKDITKLKSRYIYLLLLGTIPAIIVGFIFQEYIEILFVSTQVVGVALIITGFMNYFVDSFNPKNNTPSRKDSIIIGIAQAMAIIPGISRSGSTVFTGVARGVTRKNAAKFSFLLSIPAVFGASVLQFISHADGNNLQASFYIIGFISSLITGFFAIKWTIKLLQDKNFKYFAYYCFVLGVIALLL